MKKTLLHLARDTGIVYGAQMTGVVVGLALSILISRLLGPDGRGAYAWIMTMYFMGTQLGLAGAETLNRRLGASRRELASTLAGNSLIQSIFLGGAAGLAVFGLALLQPVGITHKMGTLLGMMAVPWAVMTASYVALAGAHHKPGLIASTEISQRLLLVLGVGTAYLSLGYLSLNMVMVGLVAAMVLTGILAAWQMTRITPLPWRFDARLWLREKWLLAGGLGSGMAMFGLQKLDLIMLGWWRPLAESGWYAVAQALMDASLILPGTLGVLLLSRLAAMETRAEQRLMLGRVLMIVVSGFAVVAGVTGWLGSWFIPLLFGEQFVAAVPVFHVLMGAAVAGAAYFICQNAATGVGRVRYVMLAPVTGMCVKALLGLELIPSMGMMGAAWANVAAYGCAAVVALAVAWGRRRG